MAFLTIRSDTLIARINPHGAELSHLHDAQGRELMTDADPAFWTGRAPILFPIVGALACGRYRLDGVDYALPKHGFARVSDFAVVEAAPDRAVLRLEASAATRAVYPFDFALTLAFAVEGATLSLTATLDNPGDRDLPASFGFHPAFAWPLPYGQARADHRMVFDEAEPGEILELNADGLIAGERPSPIDRRTLRLTDDLFADDALIWNPVKSRGLRYGADEGPHLRIAWEAAELGVWTKPGAHFVCVEPWWGEADPVGYSGDIWEKPGIQRLAPGERQTFAMSVTLQA